MIKYVGKRLAQGLLLLVVFLVLLYVLLELQPGDISNQLIANPEIPPEAQQIMRERLGIDQPLFTRTLTYVVNFFQGDLGNSFSQYPNTVSKLIMERLPRTIVLFLSAVLLSYYMGFLFGKVMAWRRGRASETALTLAGVAGYTVFYPWFAILMLWFWGFVMGWFPVGKFIDVSEWTGAPIPPNQVFQQLLITVVIVSFAALAVVVVSRRLDQATGTRVRQIGIPLVILGFVAFWWFSSVRSFMLDIVHHTALPVLTLSLVNFAGVMLLTRASMLETLREDYILTARAKGLPERTIRDKHAARNALLPVVTSLVLALSYVIGGGILTEVTFSWPGIGEMLLAATVLEDIPLATGTLGIIAVLALLGHIVVDVLYMFLDPRIRHS